MVKSLLRSWILCLATALAAAPLRAQESIVVAPPRVFLLDGARLNAARARIAAGDRAFEAALARIEADAAKVRARGPFSVVNKGVLPPSGDKHDYLSQGIYWWPNPATPDGLPYLNRDGQINPETKLITDVTQMGEMAGAVEALAQSFFFTRNEADAARAGVLLRTWFLDGATRMNPHLQYAQFIPGVAPQGRYSGIVDTETLIKVPDAVGMLAGSKGWRAEDEAGMRRWFGAYATWLLESKHGKTEARSNNNHGTVYDAQVASFALFAGQTDNAKQVLAQVGPKRIARLIEPDGKQPDELRRTKAWTYSVKSLQALFWLGALGDKAGVDIWNYRTPDGRSIRAALDYLLPFASGEQTWPHAEIGRKPDWKPGGLSSFLRRAALQYNEPKYAAALAKSAPNFAGEKVSLLWAITNG